MTDLITTGWADYELLDTGEGRKLERYGTVRIDRPEPQAMWPRRQPELWADADAVFMGNEDQDNGRWKFRDQPFETWPLSYQGCKFLGRLTPFRHVGFFPEQAPHWDWMTEQLKTAHSPSLLNLFGYTGVASLLAAQTGAEVTHVDASKKAIGWAKENQELAQTGGRPVRWIIEDARKFTAREGRRNRKYTGILVDPPKFGRGPNKEVWDLFDDLPEMLTLCCEILAPGGFLILTTYAVRASHWALYELCRSVFPDTRIMESGELLLAPKGDAPRLSTSLYCRLIRS